VPIHIDNLTSRVHVATGELPLTDEQLTKLAELVAARLATQAKQTAAAAEATELRRSAAPPSPVVE
jgi:hypothetical protein